MLEHRRGARLVEEPLHHRGSARWGHACVANNAIDCTLGTAVARDLRCAGGTTQDEIATLHTAFCGP